MKSALYARIIKLAVAEVMIQAGFECVTEQALNVSSELFTFFMESLIRKLIPFNEASSDVQLRRILTDFIHGEEYQVGETIQFIEQQNVVKRHIKDKPETEGDTNLLSMLKILPKDLNIKSNFKNSKTVALEQKEAPVVCGEVCVDSYLSAFIEECQKIPAVKIKHAECAPIPDPLESIVQERSPIPLNITFDNSIDQYRSFEKHSSLEGISNLNCRRVFRFL